jgi:hypothetical protein
VAKGAEETFATNGISELEETGISGITIGSYLKAIKSWKVQRTRLDERISVPKKIPSLYPADVGVDTVPEGDPWKMILDLGLESIDRLTLEG